MKASRLLAVAGISLLGLFVAATAIAQTDGDFRSFQSGDWSDVGSWERYNGTIWVNPAPNAPTSTDGAVNILGGDTITVAATDSIDQLTVDAGGVLVVNSGVTFNIGDGTGTDLSLNGTLDNAGSVTLDAGAEIAVGDGGLYRHAQNGGTIPTATWGTGSTCEVTGAVGNAPSNASQNYHHFTWNCPGQTSNLNLAWDNITIGGNVTVISSGGSRFQFTSSTYSGTTITINGDLIVSGGAVASNGSSGAATYTIEVMGDVIVTAGNLGVSRGSGGNATWRLHGDMSVSNATIQSSNSQSRFVFAKADTQTVSFSSVSYQGDFQYEVDSGSVVVIADGPDAVDVTVRDDLICRGEVVVLGALSFTNGAFYVHQRAGGSVPVATWETGSTCKIIGYTSGSKPGNLNQNFDDFVWDCAGQTANVDWGWYENTIAGDVIVKNTGSARAYLTSPGAGTPNTINVNGNIVLEAGQFSSNGSSSAADITVNTMGDVTVTGGTFAVSRGSQSSGAGSVTWNLYGDFTMSNATTQNSNPTEGQAKFVFTKEGTQNLSLSSVTFGGGGLPMEVDSGATLNIDTSVVGGSGMFMLDAGASLETAHPGGVDGNLQMSGTITLSEGANYTFNGSVAQTTGLLMPDSVTGLAFNNAAGVVLNDTVSCADLQVPAGVQLTIADTASLTAAAGSVLGTVMNMGGFDGSASLTFGDGAMYSHDRDGGSVPTATWETGSTCQITGVTSNSPDNMSQGLYNFIWNCPGQSSNLDWGWANNTIGGDVSVLSTGAGSSRARMTSPGATPDGPNVITILGAINVNNAAFESNGSSSQDTITIESYGDITATGGALAVSRGSGPMVMWNVYGDFTLDNAETRNSGGEKASFYFKKSGTQSLKLINPTFAGGGLPVVVMSGSTLNLDTSVIAGSGAFAVEAGAGLETAHPDGVDGNLQTSGTITLSEGSNYTFNGSVAQTTGLLMPDSVTGLTFNNAAGVVLNDTVSCADLQIPAGIQLTIADTASLTAAAGSVLGTVMNMGGFDGSASLTFGGGAVYSHDRDGGSVPTATWETGSTCQITGVTSNSPDNMSQGLYNFIWNCPGQSSNLDWGWANNTIGGDVSVLNTGSSRARMTSPGATPDGPNVITILGAINVNNAAFESNGSSSQDTITIESYGDITATGGIFAVSRGSGPVVMWNVYGDLTFDNAETRNSGGEKASYYFKKSGTQSLRLINPTFAGGGLPVVVMSGSTLKLDSSVVAGSGAFAVQAGATLATTLPGGFDENITTTGTVSLDTAASYMLNGVTPQVTGSILPSKIFRMIIDNPAGVTLSAPVAVSDTLHLASGKLALGNNALTAPGVVGASPAVYVVTDGTGSLTIPSVGATQVPFPVGTASAFAPVWISNAITADAFSVSVAPDSGSGKARVNLTWDIAEGVAGGSNATIQFGWMASEENAAFASDRAGNAKIFNLADTTEAGSGAYSGQFSSEPYTLSRGGFTSFGRLAVGNFTGPTSVDGKDGLPTVFALEQNYPNPFNPTTLIRYDLPEARHVTINIYDALGRQVTELVNRDQVAGFHKAEWNALGVASGVYFYRIVAGNFVEVKKMMLIR